MRLSVRWSVMPNSGSMTLRREERDRQAADRIVGGNEVRADGQPVPACRRGTCRTRRRLAGSTGVAGRLDREVACASAASSAGGVAAVQILEHAVVVEDGHLVVGKERRRGNSRCGRRPLPARRGDARRGGRAVMAVGDVERGQGIDGAGERGDRGRRRRPPTSGGGRRRRR